MNGRAGAPDFAQHVEIQAFDLVTRPRGFTQKLQARSNAGFTGKAANVNALAQAVPTIMRRQRGDDGFELDAVQRITRLLRAGGGRGCHCLFIFQLAAHRNLRDDGRTHRIGRHQLWGRGVFFRFFDHFVVILLTFCHDFLQ